MATELKASVKLTASDGISAKLRNLSREAKGTARDVEHSAGRMTIAGRLMKKALAPEIGRIKSAWGAAKGIIRGAAVGIGAAAAGIVVGGVAATKSYVEMADRLNDLSTRTKVSVEAIQEWRHVAQMSGSSAEEFDAGIERLARNIGKLQGKKIGKGGLVDKVVPDLGKALRGSGSLEAKFGLIVAVLRKIEDPAKRAALATALMGTSGRKLAQISGSSADEIKKLREEAQRYGVVSTEDAQKAAELADAQDRLSASLSGLRTAALSQLVPDITRMVDKLTEWVAANRNIIASRVAETVRQIGDYLKNIDWQGIGQSIKDVYGGIKEAVGAIGDFVKAIGGWGVALGGLFTLTILPGILKTIGALRTAIALSNTAGAAGAAGGAANAAGAATGASKGLGLLGLASKLAPWALAAWAITDTNTPVSSATGEAAVGVRQGFFGGEAEFPLQKLLGSAIAQGREAQKPVVQLDIRMTPEVKRLFTAQATSDPSKVGVRQVGGR